MVWYNLLHSVLTKLGFSRSPVEPALWFKDDVLIISWVDDLLIAGPLLKIITIKQHLNANSTITDLGEAKRFVGIDINYDKENKTIKIHQSEFIQQLLADLNIEGCNPTSIPMQPKITFDTSPSSKITSKSEIKEYQSAVGRLLYLMNGSRPDLSFSVTKLAQFSSGPYASYVTALKSVIRYVKSTQSHTLVLKPTDLILSGFYDAAFMDNEKYRTTYGYAFSIGNALISWKTKKHSITTLSTTESEYVAACEACRELIWLRSILESIGLPQKIPTLLYGDNQPAIAIMYQDEYHSRSKHIGLRQRFIAEKVQEGIVQPVHVGTKDMRADVLTKPLPQESFEHHITALGVRYELSPRNP